MKNNNNYDYIIVGGGLCGLVLAKELSSKKKRILILEKGNFIKKIGSLKYSWRYYDKFSLLSSKQGIGIYRIFGVGGSSMMSCGNAIEPAETYLNKLGIDLKIELAESKAECQYCSDGFPIRGTSRKLISVFEHEGYKTKIMPKFGKPDLCISCGNCVLGCVTQARWTPLPFLENFINTDIVCNFSVKRVLSSHGKVIGVEGRNKKYYAETVVLSAGGIGTPIILQNSEIDAGSNLFLDLFTVTYGVHPKLSKNKEMQMNFLIDQFYEDKGFVLAPFKDNFIAFMCSINKSDLVHLYNYNKMIGIMTKIADEASGSVLKDGSILKETSKSDLEKLNQGIEIAKDILIKCGVDSRIIISTKPRGAHPGGTAGLGKVVNNRLETQIKNLYVCDASILPHAPGFPPMLLLIALAKWFSKKI